MDWFERPVRATHPRQLRVPLARCVVSIVAALAIICALFPAPSEASSPLLIPSCANAGVAANATFASAIPVGAPTTLPPAITAKAAVIVDGETGRVLYDLRAHDRMSPASTTKIMTAILAIEHGDLDRSIVSDIDAKSLPTSSVMGLRIGVSLTARELLYGLLLPSGNDAALVLARNISGSEQAFVAAMNAKAVALNLRDTHFVNPHGLDRIGHYSSAYDLAMIARYGMTLPLFAQFVGTKDHHLPPPLDYDLHNGNTLLDMYPGADGVKVGWTERAGWTFVASATRNGHQIFVTVLNSKDRDADAVALMDWAWQSYRWIRLAPSADQALRLASRFGIAIPLVRAASLCR